MKKRICALLIATGISLPGYFVYGQSTLSLTLANLRKQSTEYPVEKVYLHIDRPFYSAGDTIWFKAYVITGGAHQLSGLSGVLNVELINEQNTLVHHIKLPVVSGITFGDFALPDTVRGGNYRIRAYTNWMRNAGADYFFDKNIRIINTSASNMPENKYAVNKTNASKVVDDPVDVQFFPESGNLVNSLLSKVAFKAVGSNGLGSDISGTVTDNQNNIITAFASTHLGMGCFFLAPEAGRTYKAHITYANGTTGVVDLPKAVDNGNVMTIRADSANTIVKIDRKGDQNITDSLTLIIDAGGEVYAQAKVPPDRASSTASISKNKLPSGIVRLTLFSGQGEPLNERLVFVQNPDKLSLNLHIANKFDAQQRKIKIDLNAKGPDGQAVQGNFSVSVIDESKIPLDEGTESTIFSNILLSSDIKGYIEKPNYYFTKTSKKTTADLDVLMMTQGYHRYAWKQIMSNPKLDTIYPYQKALTIAGSIEDPDGRPLANSKLTLINTTTNLLLDTIADKNGRFIFNLDFTDGSKFSLKGGAKNGVGTLIKLDDTTLPLSNNKNSADELVNPGTELDAYIQKSKNEHELKAKYQIGHQSTLLKQVNIKTGRAKTEKELKIEHAVEYSSNLNGKGNADQVVTSEVFEGMGCPTTADCLEGKLLGITFDQQGQPQALRGRSSINLSTKMLVIVDGILSQSGSINDINPQYISSIEVLRSAGTTAIYGTRGANGVLIVTTKHDQGFTVNKKTLSGFFTPQGYYKAREFYSPRYDRTVINPPLDLRNTIYWAPIIQTDRDGNASFDYFNADSKGPYRVVIEGVDYNGHLGRQVLTYSLSLQAQ